MKGQPNFWNYGPKQAKKKAVRSTAIHSHKRNRQRNKHVTDSLDKLFGPDPEKKVGWTNRVARAW